LLVRKELSPPDEQQEVRIGVAVAPERDCMLVTPDIDQLSFVSAEELPPLAQRTIAS
jgi:hypothetical protein